MSDGWYEFVSWKLKCVSCAKTILTAKHETGPWWCRNCVRKAKK